MVTTGTFDGVHEGHQKIIKRLKEVAAEIKGETVLLTFYPHPRMVLFPDDAGLKLLTTQEEKILLLERAGVEHLIIHPFSIEFSRLSSVEFVRDVLINKIGTKKLIIGYNHHFGRNREGSFDNLKEFCVAYDFDVEQISAQDVDDVEISSTKIRNALLAGDITTANKYLGYEYFLGGTVVKGKEIGRTINYPTANIEIADKYKQIPADGVYAVTIEYKEEIWKGMMNIGINPTLNATKKTLEVNIFDFDEMIYNSSLRIYFHQRIRDAIKFENLDQLQKQLSVDKETSLHLLNN